MVKKRTIELTLNGSTGNYDLDLEVLTDDVSSYATNGAGGTTVTLLEKHDIAEGGTVTIANSATTAYNGDHVVFNVNGNSKTFDIPVTYDDNPLDGDTSFERRAYDEWIISHLRHNAPGHQILAGDKDDPHLQLLAELHNVALNFKES